MDRKRCRCTIPAQDFGITINTVISISPDGNHEALHDDPPPYDCAAAGDQDGVKLTWTEDVERLRRFLSFSLAIVYGIERKCPDRLTKSEWLQWVELGKLEAQYSEQESPTEPHFRFTTWFHSLPTSTWWVHPDVMQKIIHPARILGIRPTIVRDMLRSFVLSMWNSWPSFSLIQLIGDGYNSVWAEREYLMSSNVLAQRLLTDRDEVIERVLAPGQFRTRLFEELHERRSQYFEVLTAERRELTRYGARLPTIVSRFARRHIQRNLLTTLSQIERSRQYLDMGEEEAAGLTWWGRSNWRSVKSRESAFYIIEDEFNMV